MYCPFKFNNKTLDSLGSAHGVASMPGCQCEYSECGFWDYGRHRCSICMIADAFASAMSEEKSE